MGLFDNKKTEKKIKEVKKKASELKKKAKVEGQKAAKIAKEKGKEFREKAKAKGLELGKKALEKGKRLKQAAVLKVQVEKLKLNVKNSKAEIGSLVYEKRLPISRDDVKITNLIERSYPNE